MRVSERDQQILKLCGEGLLPQREIAEEMKCSTSVIINTVHKFRLAGLVKGDLRAGDFAIDWPGIEALGAKRRARPITKSATQVPEVPARKLPARSGRTVVTRLDGGLLEAVRRQAATDGRLVPEVLGRAVEFYLTRGVE